jgi:hypothetical protein
VQQEPAGASEQATASTDPDAPTKELDRTTRITTNWYGRTPARRNWCMERVCYGSDCRTAGRRQS